MAYELDHVLPREDPEPTLLVLSPFASPYHLCLIMAHSVFLYPGQERIKVGESSIPCVNPILLIVPLSCF